VHKLELHLMDYVVDWWVSSLPSEAGGCPEGIQVSGFSNSIIQCPIGVTDIPVDTIPAMHSGSYPRSSQNHPKLPASN